MRYEDLSDKLRKDIEGAEYAGTVRINKDIIIEYDFSNQAEHLIECPCVRINGNIISYKALRENNIDIQDNYTESDGMEYRTDVNEMRTYSWEFMKSTPSFNEVLSESKNEDDFLNKIEKAVINAFDFEELEKYKVKDGEKSAKEVFEGFNQVVKNGNDFDKAIKKSKEIERD